MLDNGRHAILGVSVNAIDYDGAVERIIEASRARRPCAVSALAVHGLMTGALDATHRYRLNRLDLLVPDGQPVRWALNLLFRARLADRVYGPELMLRVCRRAAAERLPIFLFGGSEELLQDLSERLQETFPQLQIAGMRASRFRTLAPVEREALAREIQQSGAALTFVGLGCPRQEVFAFEFRDQLAMPILAVGAAFNFHAARLVQAPAWMQKRGLEWLFRLLAEPKRLWRRYLVLNPLYCTLLALQFLRLYRIDPQTAVRPTAIVGYG